MRLKLLRANEVEPSPSVQSHRGCLPGRPDANRSCRAGVERKHARPSAHSMPCSRSLSANVGLPSPVLKKGFFAVCGYIVLAMHPGGFLTMRNRRETEAGRKRASRDCYSQLQNDRRVPIPVPTPPHVDRTITCSLQGASDRTGAPQTCAALLWLAPVDSYLRRRRK